MLATSYHPDDGHPKLTGVVLAITPGNSLYGVEVQRTSDVGGGVPASSAAVDIALLDYVPVSGIPLLDAQPLDGQYRFYRARQWGDAVDPGAWTAWTSGVRPVQVDANWASRTVRQFSVLPYNPIPAMADGTWGLAAATATRNQPTSALYLATTQALVVGTSGTPSTIKKTMRFPHASFLTEYIAGLGVAVNANVGDLDVRLYQSSTGPASQKWICGMTFPPGVTLTAVRAAEFLGAGTSYNSAQVFFDRVDSPGSAVTLATLTGTGSSWQVLTAAINQVVTSSQSFIGIVLLACSSATLGDYAGCAYLEVDYTMPSYDKGL